MHLGTMGATYKERLKARYNARMAAIKRRVAARKKKGGFMGPRKRAAKKATPRPVVVAPTPRPQPRPAQPAPQPTPQPIPRPIPQVIREEIIYIPAKVDKKPEPDYIQETQPTPEPKKLPILPLILVAGAAIMTLKG